MADKKKTSKTKTTKTSAKAISKKIEYTLARSNDGTIQINFTLPYAIVETKREEVLKILGKDLTVPGFRKGKAPLTKVAEHVPQDTVIQKTLGQILPQEVGNVIKKDKIRPALYPKFELLKAMDNEPWEVRATTCELPEVTLGDYKKKIKGTGKAEAIWTPDKGKPEEKQEKPPEMQKAEKEQTAIKALLENINITIPKLLIEEEVNSKLSQLLARIEKLGLNLESYLTSVGKNPQSLRGEYEVQAKSTIALDLILTEIAKEEKVVVHEKEVEAALAATKVDPEMAKKAESEEQKRIVTSVLTRRKALDSVIALL